MSSGSDASTYDEEALRARFRTLRETGNSRVRDDIVVDHMWIARSVARRFDQRGESFDDLVQVASLGLVKAVDRFDPEMGTNFVSFAMPTVVGEVRRYFRDHTWSVRVPRSAKELKPRITKAIEQLQHETGRSPTVAEIADNLQLDVDTVLEAMKRPPPTSRRRWTRRPGWANRHRRHIAGWPRTIPSSAAWSTPPPFVSCWRPCPDGAG